MNSTVVLAERLLSLDDAEIAKAISERRPRTVGVRDVFDLAEQFLAPTSIDRGLSRLTRDELIAIARGDVAEGQLDALLLGHDGRAYPEVQARAAVVVAALEPATTSHDDGPRVMPEAEAKLALHSGLVHVALMRDLLTLIDSHGASLTAAGVLTKSTQVDLEQRMPTTDANVVDLVGALMRAGLVGTVGVTLQVDRVNANQVLGQSLVELWLWFVSSWQSTLSPATRSVLSTSPWQREELLRRAAEQYPVDVSWIEPNLVAALTDALLLGLTSPVGEVLVGHDSLLSPQGLPSVAGFARAHAPGETNEFIVQHDLTVVAPAPLSPGVEARLSRMTTVESRGLASTFRLTEASLRRAIESGDTAQGILDFLAKGSLTPVPGNVAYLIKDAERRVDSGHSGLGLTSMRTVPAPPPTIGVGDDDVVRLIRRIRESGSDPGSGWLGRQLALAVRDKQRIRVVVTMPEGEREFILDATALANGRLRGRDVRGAVERTLPVALITSVGIAD